MRINEGLLESMQLIFGREVCKPTPVFEVASIDSFFQVVKLLRSLLPQWTGLTWYCRNDGVWFLRLGHKRHYNLQLALSLLAHWSEASCHVMRSLKQPCVEKSMWTPANNQHKLTRHTSETPWRSSPSHTLRTAPLPRLTSRLQSHETPWLRPTQLSHSQIPDLQKLYEVTCLLFSATKFGESLPLRSDE